MWELSKTDMLLNKLINTTANQKPFGILMLQLCHVKFLCKTDHTDSSIRDVLRAVRAKGKRARYPQLHTSTPAGVVTLLCEVEQPHPPKFPVK